MKDFWEGYWWGVYIGGSNMACANDNIAADWVRTEVQRGWRLLFIWVRPQAPCTNFADKKTSPSGSPQPSQAEPPLALREAAVLTWRSCNNPFAPSPPLKRTAAGSLPSSAGRACPHRWHRPRRTRRARSGSGRLRDRQAWLKRCHGVNQRSTEPTLARLRHTGRLCTRRRDG